MWAKPASRVRIPPAPPRTKTKPPVEVAFSWPNEAHSRTRVDTQSQVVRRQTPADTLCFRLGRASVVIPPCSGGCLLKRVRGPIRLRGVVLEPCAYSRRHLAPQKRRRTVPPRRGHVRSTNVSLPESTVWALARTPAACPSAAPGVAPLPRRVKACVRRDLSGRGLSL